MEKLIEGKIKEIAGEFQTVPGVLFEDCALDNFRDDLVFSLGAERGDVPDHDSLEAYITQPVRQYVRRAI